MKVADVIWREDLYPRVKRDPALAQRYAEDLAVLPPIEVNRKGELIDGWHRWTAHKSAGADTIMATVTETIGDLQLLAIAAKRNSTFGWQMDKKSKRHVAQMLYQRGAGYLPEHAAQTDGAGKAEGDAARHARIKADIADHLGVTPSFVSGFLSDIDADLRAERRNVIFGMWLACHTQEEIAKAAGEAIGGVNREIGERSEIEAVQKLNELPDGRNGKDAYRDAMFSEAGWEPPLYDIWNPAKNSNDVSHFGNTPVEFVDNLIYTFTKPFGVVVDPFAGGGSTIDVCRKRLRRYWVGDRAPIVAREDEIRQHDLIDGDGSVSVGGPARWGDVQVVYLDPPYWKQAAGQYSEDPTDLANMPLDEFTDALVGIIHGYAAKLKPGAHIACITSPTQWPNENHEAVYHDLDLARLVAKKLKLVRRVLCPYSTQQYNGTQVEIAKTEKLWLTLTRTMLIWERTA